MRKKIYAAYDRLLEHYGPRRWWPGDSALEIIVGAVLTQNTSWKNVELAIKNLKSARVLELKRLHRIDLSKLAELIRPSGYYRLKAQRLWNLIDFIVREYGDLKTMFLESMPKLRGKLLGVNGIGPETADSILLYAGEMPSFVVDTYTHRVAKRHGWIDRGADYQQVKSFFESHLDRDTRLFNEYHALLVNVGKDYCKPTPVCQDCPLCDMLTSKQPIQWPVRTKER